jgi:hypothetical protein
MMIVRRLVEKVPLASEFETHSNILKERVNCMLIDHERTGIAAPDEAQQKHNVEDMSPDDVYRLSGT